MNAYEMIQALAKLPPEKEIVCESVDKNNMLLTWMIHEIGEPANNAFPVPIVISFLKME
jgi:hypothetical protein